MKTMQSDIGFCNIRPTTAIREYARRRHRSGRGRRPAILKLSATTKRATGRSCARLAKARDVEYPDPIGRSRNLPQCRLGARTIGWIDEHGNTDRLGPPLTQPHAGGIVAVAVLAAIAEGVPISDHDRPTADPSQPSARSGAVGYPPLQATAKDRRPRPDWAAVHRELSRLG
jgi:hypothetical protein